MSINFEDIVSVLLELGPDYYEQIYTSLTRIRDMDAFKEKLWNVERVYREAGGLRFGYNPSITAAENAAITEFMRVFSLPLARAQHYVNVWIGSGCWDTNELCEEIRRYSGHIIAAFSDLRQGRG